MDLEARVSELSVELDQSRAEREQYRKLYLEMLERCALLERGLIAGKKAERFTGNDGQLTLMVLGQVLAKRHPSTLSPQASTPVPVSWFSPNLGGMAGDSRSVARSPGAKKPSDSARVACL